MEHLLFSFIKRFAPRIGWPVATLMLVAACCPALAASEGGLPLPGGLIFWAGVGGMLLGLRAGRAARYPRLLLFGLLALAGGTVLLLAGGRATPPFSLLWSDLANLGAALARWWQRLPPEPLPAPLTPRFLATALPRFWGELVAAPAAGKAGATLLLTVLAISSTWIGTLCLGVAVGARRSSFAASLPLLAALASITILNGSNGVGLIGGLATLLLLAVVTGQRSREQAWDRQGALYSSEFGIEVITSSTIVIAGLLGLAFLLPTALPNVVINLFWPVAELPSGLAVISEQVAQPRPQPTAQVGLSQLPALELGISLSEGAPETIALRIRTGGPLHNSPWPHYWRGRVLHRYDGRQWRADARVSPFGPPLAATDRLPPGMIVQEIEDQRRNPRLLLALPDLIGLDIVANGERLADGTLVAVTADSPQRRYRALSLPPELAPLPPPQYTNAPPDMRLYLALPSTFSPRVRELAQAVAGGTSSTLEQALALESYLRQLPYSYRVQPLPRQGDAVDQFLFEMREGYCTYYASAMATMARSLGIPARLATGYATGSYDAALGGYVVREAEAHAWPELLIDGRWLPFEPTPVRPLPSRDPTAPASEPAIAVAEPPTTTSVNWLQWLLIGTGLVGSLGALVGGWLIIQRGRGGPLAQAQRHIERLGERAHIAWPAGATLHEYAELIEAHHGGEMSALRNLVTLIEQSRYGGHAFDATQRKRLAQAVGALRAWVRR
jgi:transglutaminase-like putative cysteine protease